MGQSVVFWGSRATCPGGWLQSATRAVGRWGEVDANVPERYRSGQEPTEAVAVLFQEIEIREIWVGRDGNWRYERYERCGCEAREKMSSQESWRCDWGWWPCAFYFCCLYHCQSPQRPTHGRVGQRVSSLWLQGSQGGRNRVLFILQFGAELMEFFEHVWTCLNAEWRVVDLPEPKSFCSLLALVLDSGACGTAQWPPIERCLFVLCAPSPTRTTYRPLSSSSLRPKQPPLIHLWNLVNVAIRGPEMHFSMALAGCIVLFGIQVALSMSGIWHWSSYASDSRTRSLYRTPQEFCSHQVGHGGSWWAQPPGGGGGSLRGKPWRSKATSRFGDPERKPWWMQWCSDAVQMYLVNIYSESRALKSLKSGFPMIFPYHQDISRLHHVTRVACHWGFWSSHQCHQCHQSLGDGKVITAVILSNGSPRFCRVVA